MFTQGSHSVHHSIPPFYAKPLAALLASCFLFAGCEQLADRIAPRFRTVPPETTSSAPEFVFGPVQLFRNPGTTQETRTFSITGFVGPFILNVQNGPPAEAGGSQSGFIQAGTVSLNNSVILGASDNLWKGPTVRRVEVGLQDPSTLTVKINGTPGGTLLVWIEGTKGGIARPEGGSVSDPDGHWTLTFPNGAVLSPTTVTVTPPSTPLPDDPAPIAGTAFEFGPNGTQFAAAVTLSIHYDPQTIPSGVLEPDLRLMKLVSGRWLPVAGSSVNVATKEVSGVITSFSSYAVVPPTTAIPSFVRFQATFNNDAVDAPPGPPEVGSWFFQATDGGAILVRSAIGNLTGHPVELLRTGPGELIYIGAIAGTRPTGGVFLFSWRSLVHSGTVGGAVAVSGVDAGGVSRPIFALAYAEVGRTLTYNDVAIPVSWTPDVAQTFEVTIDLDNKVTTLRIDGSAVVTGTPFFDGTAQNIGRISFQMGASTPLSFAIDDLELTQRRKILVYGPSINLTPNVINEGIIAAQAGFDVVVARTAVEWSPLTTADFAAFDAIVFGDDASCTQNSIALAPAEANASVWSPAVTGPIVVMGANPGFHYQEVSSVSAARILVVNGIRYAASVPGHTGLYVSLSCRYQSAVTATPVALLLGLGDFRVHGLMSNYGMVTLPGHPLMQGLSNASLSNWGSSVHEVFDRFPSSFVVVAVGGSGVGANGAPLPQGSPYIVARPALP